MSQSLKINGHLEARFEPIKRVFEASLAAGEEVGAAVAITLHGEPVVDLWAGHSDQAKTREWQEDTIANVYSTTKGMTAICAHQLVDRGELDLDAPVSKYWPEFAQNTKQDLPVRWLLSHRVGLPAVKELLPPEALYDWDAMVSALAAQEPWWKPGQAHGYHAVSFGWLVGEVVRRISGRSLGRYFREEIAEPLGLDFMIGTPDEHHERIAEMSAMAMPEPEADGPNLGTAMLMDPEGMLARAFMNPPSMALGPNTAEWRRAEIPAANGHGTARSLARVYGALANGGELQGVRVLTPQSIERCHTEQSRGPDEVLQISTRFGLGFMLSQGTRDTSFGPNPRAFGHPGAGGSLGFADPDTGIGFGYVMNKMGPSIVIDARAANLIEATYASLA